jgi:GT2 family glycosyltransferase
VISVVVLTHNRVHLLRRCVNDVLRRASPETGEIVIWDNGSTDGTREYLESLADPRIMPVLHPENIGQNAYARAFAQTSGDYLVELDDDVVEAPQDWDRLLLDALVRLPHLGYLAADVADDPYDEAAFLRYRLRPHEYREHEVDGIRLLQGPTGGACAITSRELYDRIGGFRQDESRICWPEDATYISDVRALGLEAAILADLQVHHAGGPHYAAPAREKLTLVAEYHREIARRNAVKRVLLRVPFVARLNARRGWFVPPDDEWQAYLRRSLDGRAGPQT